MNSKNLFQCLFLGLTCLVFNLNSQAQTSKIAIVSVADTIFVHRHVGLTVFTNFTDTLPVNFSIINHLEKKIQFYCKENYSVSVVQLPDSVLKLKDGFFSSPRTKKLKQWIKSTKALYDYVIVIDNMGLSEIYSRLIPKNTSGLFSRISDISYYSTISFFAYHTSDLKVFEFYNEGGQFIMPFKNFKLPEDKRSFTPEMKNTLYDGFKTYLDSRVEYFLSKTYLVPQDRIDAIKTQSVTNK